MSTVPPVSQALTQGLTWEQVLTAVEQDVDRTEALLREPVQVSPSVRAYLAPAVTLLPQVEPFVPSPATMPPLESMPPVPPELSSRIDELRTRVQDLQSQLREAVEALRVVSSRPAGPVLSVVAPTPAHYFDSRL